MLVEVNKCLHSNIGISPTDIHRSLQFLLLREIELIQVYGEILYRDHGTIREAENHKSGGDFDVFYEDFVTVVVWFFDFFGVFLCDD